MCALDYGDAHRPDCRSRHSGRPLRDRGGPAKWRWRFHDRRAGRPRIPAFPAPPISPDQIPPGGWLPKERVSFEQALHGFTRGAAYAGFAEERIGSLDVGKWADFIIVDRDVSSVDPQSLGRTQVLETWVAGKKVWERVPSAGAERGR